MGSVSYMQPIQAFCQSNIHGAAMRSMAFAILALSAWIAIPAQQTGLGAGATTINASPNLPVAKIGPNDLLGITVYDSPELTRTARVSAEGDIRLPMVKQHIRAAGLYPEELESAIAAVLTKNQILVDPLVSVAIMEYQSRPISVVGSVRSPVTFQAMGNVTLLDAITHAQGLADNAGPEILVSHPDTGTDGKPTTLVKRVPVRGLLYEADSSLNLTLQPGDQVRVPEASKVYVFGNVQKPGFFYLTDDTQTSVMVALALSSGLSPHSANKAYIYREEAGTRGRNEIPIPIKKIIDRKAPDVALMANDILYIPDATGRRVALNVLQTSIPIAAALGTTMLYIALR